MPIASTRTDGRVPDADGVGLRVLSWEGFPADGYDALVEEAARLLPHATVKWYAGADHDVHAQCPAEVAADLRTLA